MDKKIKNKIIKVENILHIVELMKNRSQYYIYKKQEEDFKKKQALEKEEFYSALWIDNTIKYIITYNSNETITKENDFEWFTYELNNNVKSISEVELRFSGYEDNSSENITLKFSENEVYYNVSLTNTNDNQLELQIENYINSLPPRFDKIVNMSTRRTLIPAFTFSIPLSLILCFALLILSRVEIIPENIAKYLSTGISLSIIFITISFLSALLIPTKNSKLYKNIKFNTVYAGWNEKLGRSEYKDDFIDYKEKCETAIGRNSDLPRVRNEIEENYLKSKKILKIEAIIAIASMILFFII